MKNSASCCAGIVFALLCACAQKPADPSIPPVEVIGSTDTRTAADTLRWHEDAAFELVTFPIIEDNVAHDTLLVQVTIDMQDGSFMMVASNQEETFEGLRLYHYRLNTDGSPKMLGVSSPAYDSWTMLPTFFRAAEDPSTYIVLANFGEKQSWGQKAMLLDGSGFTDLCFLDAALPRLVNDQEMDTSFVRLENIGPRTRIITGDQRITFEFAGDSLYLFDDARGEVDRIINAQRVRYQLIGSDLQLVIDGDARPVKKPS